MAFYATRPLEMRLKHGVTLEVVDPVIITGNGAREIRRRTQRWSRFVWNFPNRIIPMSEFQQYRDILAIDPTASFQVTDPTMAFFRETTLTVYNSTGTKRTLLVDLDGGTSRRPYFNPIISELKIRKNGVIISSAGCTMTYEASLPVLNIPGALTSDVITVVGPFYPTVRFEGTLSATTVAMQRAQWRETSVVKSTQTKNDCNSVEANYVQMDSFKLIEVWEHA